MYIRKTHIKTINNFNIHFSITYTIEKCHFLRYKTKKYVYIKINDPYSVEMQRILFCFFFIKTKNIISGVSSWVRYGNVNKVEIKNQWYDYNFSKLKESIEYEFQSKYESSDIMLNYEDLSKPNTFKAKGLIILECINDEIIIPTKFSEQLYKDLSFSLEYKNRTKFYETIEEVESRIVTLSDNIYLTFEENVIIELK